MDCSIGNLLALAVALASLAFWVWLLFVRKGDVVPHPESERSDAALPGWLQPPGPRRLAPIQPAALALCRAFVAAHEALAGTGLEVVTARCEAGAALASGQCPMTLVFTVRVAPGLEPGGAAEPEGARDAPEAPGGGRAALALWHAGGSPPRAHLAVLRGGEIDGSSCFSVAVKPEALPLLQEALERAGPGPDCRAEVDGVHEPGAAHLTVYRGGRPALGLLAEVGPEAARALAETLASLRAGPGDAPPPTRRRVELRDADCDAGCGVPALRLALPDGSSRWLRVGREAAWAAGRWLVQAGQAGWRLTVAQVRESGGVWTLLLDDGHTALGTLVVPEEAGRAAREMLGG